MSSRSDHRRLLLPLLLSVACGDEPRRAGPERSADEDAGSQGSAAGDTGSADAGEVEIEPAVAPPPGACGVVRRMEIPAERRTVRAPGGFVVGPEPGPLRADHAIEWLAISDDGHRRVQFAGTQSPELSLAMLPIGPDPFAGDVLNLMRAESGSDGRVSAERIPHGVPEPSQDIGSAFYRGSLQKAAAVSLDGRRMIYATGHVAVDKPHAFVIDERGTRVADPLVMSGQASPLFSCLAVTPTEHGAVVSFIDSEQRVPAMRLVEIGPDAEVLQDVTVEVGGSPGCATVHLAQRGFWVSVPGVAPNTFDLLAIDAGQVAVRESGLSRAPGWVGESPSGELLSLIGSRLSRKSPSNDWVDVPGELPDVGGVIASEPGRLFVTTPFGLGATAELLEIACSELPRLTQSP